MKRGFGFHPRLYLLFRGLTWVAQRGFDIQHVFGSLGDWFHLKSVHSGPIVLTVAVGATPCGQELLKKVDQFVVEWPGAVDELSRLGICDSKVRIIYPPVDLDQFQPTSSPAERFTVLFASSPDKASWLSSRGVDVILDAAELCPDFQFQLIWRPWGDSLATVEHWIASRRLKNVELKVGRFRNMAPLYCSAHVTVAPFTSQERSKPSPNSIIESLACGRPVIVTPQVGISCLVEQHQAGVVAAADVGELAHSLLHIRDNWATLSVNARKLAVDEFSHSRFIDAYRQLYLDVLAA